MFLVHQSFRNSVASYNDGEIDDSTPPIETTQTNALISLILGVGSVLFTLFPYILNLYYAGNIKNNVIIKDNKKALNYFNNNAPIFIMLTVVSGGVYASLSIVSSMYVIIYCISTIIY